MRTIFTSGARQKLERHKCCSIEVLNDISGKNSFDRILIN
jgi:hypothetical protein